MHRKQAFFAPTHESVSRAGNEHDRVLQTFALVNRRYADHVFVVGQGAAFKAFSHSDAFDHSQKAGQPGRALGFVLCGQLGQHAQTVLPLRAAFARAAEGVQAGFVVDAIENALQRKHAGVFRPARKARIKLPQRLAKRVRFLAVGAGGGFKRPVWRAFADTGERRVVQPERRAAKRPQ